MTYITTNSVVNGDTIKFTEAVFSGSHRRPTFIGERTITALVLKESYGQEKQQHTFSLDVIECEGSEPLKAGQKIRRKGRNIYRNGVKRQIWTDEAERAVVADEKHARGDAARAARENRKRENAY